MEWEVKALAARVAQCNENIVRFFSAFNRDESYEFANAKAVKIKDALSWLEANGDKEWVKDCRDRNLAMARFWGNARKAFMRRLAEAVERGEA